MSCVSFSKIQFSKRLNLLRLIRNYCSADIVGDSNTKNSYSFPKRPWWEKSSRISNSFIIHVWKKKPRRCRSYSVHGLITSICKVSYMQWPICHFDWRTLNNRPQCKRIEFSRSLKSIWYVLYSLSVLTISFALNSFACWRWIAKLFLWNCNSK